jgi:flap endonuclease-1
MGVDLAGILQKHPTSFEELRGKRIAIDAFNTLYQFLTIIRQPDGTPLQDSRGRITSHLSGLFYRTCSLLEKGIRPVFVFDGEPSPLKAKTIAERVARKREAEEAMKRAIAEGRTAEAAMLAQRTARLTREMVEESKKLLSLLGVPWVQAPSEGEAQCAAMAAEGIVNAVGSQDYDSILFGAPVLVRNLTVAGKRKVPKRSIYVDVEPEEFTLSENLTHLGITRQKLIWIGLLAGTDFNEGVHGIGAKKGLKLVTEHESFDEITKALGPRAEGFDSKLIEDLFMNPPSVKVSEDDLRFGELRRDGIIELMYEEHDFSKERLESSLAKAFNEPLDSSQASLKKWF